MKLLSYNSIIPPEKNVDRGPLDDVIEQLRGQPELEEGEMGSSANLYKPSRSYTGIRNALRYQCLCFTDI